MKLTLRQLIVFAAVADTGSTTAAGERIALSQSATSAALNELEAGLQTRLFDRIGARLVLNEVGRAVLARARTVIDGAADIEREFRGGNALTPLRVGASTTIGNYLLPTLIASYLARHPEAQVDVRVENTAGIAAAVARLELDLAFVEGACHEPELVAQPWREDELVIVAAPGHPALQREGQDRLGVAVLRAQSWLLREPGSGTREAVEEALLPHLKQLQEGLRFGGTEAIKLAAAQGLGFSCLSSVAVRDWVAQKRLVQVRTTLPRLLRPLWLVQHREKQLSGGALNFIQHCRSADD
jgi:DNA-binding transcriptional LysR family regulator